MSATSRGAIGEAITLLEAERRDGTFAIARLLADIEDLRIRDRQLSSAITTLAEIGRKREASTAVAAWALDGMSGSAPWTGGVGSGPYIDDEATAEKAIDAVADRVIGEASAAQARAGEQDVDGRDEPGHDGESGDAEAVADSNAQRPSSRDVSAVDEPSPGAGPQAEASHAGDSGMPAGREGHSREGAASPAKAETASSGTAAPIADVDQLREGQVTANQVRVRIGYDPSPWRASTSQPAAKHAEPQVPAAPAYQGVGVKAPALAAPAPGDAVALPMVDERPAQPAESQPLAKAQQLANRIRADFKQLMQDYPDGPKVGDLVDIYGATDGLVRDAISRLRAAKVAQLVKRPSTGRMHMLPFGARP